MDRAKVSKWGFIIGVCCVAFASLWNSRYLVVGQAVRHSFLTESQKGSLLFKWVHLDMTEKEVQALLGGGAVEIISSQGVYVYHESIYLKFLIVIRFRNGLVIEKRFFQKEAESRSGVAVEEVALHVGALSVAGA